MANHFYAMLSRMKNIYRWGLMRNVKKESLCEHTLETAYIAHALAVISKNKFKNDIDPNYVAAAAMFHDTSEIITGDMPTPIKYYNENIKTAYKEIENIAENSLIDMLPSDMKQDFIPLYNMTDECRRLVKAADKISALIKCIEEENMGNKDFICAKQSTIEAIRKLNVKEADIFLDKFIESYSLNLDQLK